MLQTQKRSNEFFTDGCHVDPTAGHMGVKRTSRRINERFRWPGRDKYDKLVLIRYIHAETNVNARRLLNLTSVSVQIGEFCLYCTELHSVPVTSCKSPWHDIGIDFVGPISKSYSGNQYIVIISLNGLKLSLLLQNTLWSCKCPFQISMCMHVDCIDM